MRKIEFRGKRLDNGEWTVSQCQLGTMASGSMIHYFNPNTVCQYTDLIDKNGKKIYENDVCNITAEFIDKEDGYFVVKWDNEGARFILDGYKMTVSFDFVYNHEIEVVGNIFDNKELLEAAK